MSAVAFELTPGLEASEPPEARGLARDEVRLMVVSRSRDQIVHARFRDLPVYLRRGDLLVVNNSATLAAAVPATRADGAGVEVRFATRVPGDTGAGRHVIELRGAGGESLVGGGGAGDRIRAAGGGRAGERIELPGGASVELLTPYAGSGRLWVARVQLPHPTRLYLERHGRPIRYGYVPRDWPLSAYQTAYAAVPGSAEMPSAGRPFTPELITRLIAGGTFVTPVTLHTGVSSPERDEPPFPEEYEVPAATAQLINAVRGWGGRVIAVGTTVVRALETVTEPDGTVRADAGWTDLVVGPDRSPAAIDGLITGWHEPQASHLQILEAVAGRELIERSYACALHRAYLWHEFGDSHLILP